MRAKDGLGSYGERVAERHLVDAGFVVIERNWRCAHGEIDIVARDGDVLVVCEVKTRSGTSFGTPAAAVTPAKAARLRRLAAAWLHDHPVRPAGVRIDVVGLFSYVVETERRFYLTNTVDLQVRSTEGGEVYFEVTMSDAWVWDMYRPARFVKNVKVVTFKDVNVEELAKPDLEPPKDPHGFTA